MLSWFGPSRAEVWSQLAAQLGGEFVDGGFFGKTVVRVATGSWIVTLDTFSVSNGKSSTTYTRLRAPYVNADGFRFEVTRKHVFTDLGKFLFGTQDVTIGDPAFDEAFVIQGTDPERLRRLFANATLRELLDRQPQVRFRVASDEGWFGGSFPEGVDELRFTIPGVLTDLERLADLFLLFSVTLDALCAMGSAYEDPPGVHL